MRALPSADVIGRLTVKDRAAAEQALAEALAQTGGSVVSRREESGATIVDVAVPRSAYQEFGEKLARIGGWQAEGQPSDVLPTVRITLRLTR